MFGRPLPSLSLYVPPSVNPDCCFSLTSTVSPICVHPCASLIPSQFPSPESLSHLFSLSPLLPSSGHSFNLHDIGGVWELRRERQSMHLHISGAALKSSLHHRQGQRQGFGRNSAGTKTRTDDVSRSFWCVVGISTGRVAAHTSLDILEVLLQVPIQYALHQSRSHGSRTHWAALAPKARAPKRALRPRNKTHRGQQQPNHQINQFH